MLEAPMWYTMLRVPILFGQAYLGMLLFGRSLPGKKYLPVRWAACLLAGFLACYFLRLWLCDGLGLPYRVVLVLAFFMLVAAVPLCWGATFPTAIFTAANGYLAQHLGGSLKTLLRGLPALEGKLGGTWGVLLLDLVSYGGIYLILYLLFRPYRRGMDALGDRNKTAFSVLILFTSLGMAQLTKEVEGQVIPLISDTIYALGSGFLILFLEFALAQRIELGQSVDAMRELVRQQRLQYESSRENIQLINEKYHDLKQIVQMMRGKVSEQELDRLDRQVSEYDCAVVTGNEVLDVLMTEKRMVCEREEIQITTFSGGVDLSFVEDLDLYALFSNALSNAIAAVSRLPQGAERFIHVSISRAQQVVVIHVENPCAEHLEFVDGLPRTRQDERYHGFGLRSMQRTAEKYGGMLSAMERDKKFLLDIILLDQRMV